MGECYYYGRGVKKNLTKAIEYYKRAANNDDSLEKFGEIYYYGKGVDVDYKKSFEYYE